MARRKQNKLLVPAARPALEQFKARVLENEGVIPNDTNPKEISLEVAKEIGIPFSKGDNGEMSTKNAGKIGGQIGGRMVRELVKMAQEELMNRDNN